MPEQPLVVRLNHRTCPAYPEERALVEATGARWREIEGASDHEILAAALDCDVLMVVSAYLRAAVIEQMARCRLIARLGTGTDRIDVAAATRQGIMVSNLPTFCTEEVADHTLALLLAVARDLGYYQGHMQAGRPPVARPDVHRLAAQAVGLVGFGHIGRAVARRALAFGLRVLAVDPAVPAEEMAGLGVEKVELPQALAESDYLCLLCPLTPATRGLIGRAELAQMRPTAALINTARGELVVEADLVAALQAGAIRTAALDVFAGINVFSEGGFTTDHPLFGLPNVLLTPHVAAYSVESSLEQRLGGAQAVLAALAGKRPEHLVNPDLQPRFGIT